MYSGWTEVRFFFLVCLWLTAQSTIFQSWPDEATTCWVLTSTSGSKGVLLDIRKTCPCNEYPLKPHFYIAKLGYVGVYLFFLFLLQNIDCGYLLEPPRRGGSNVYPQSMF